MALNHRGKRKSSSFESALTLRMDHLEDRCVPAGVETLLGAADLVDPSNLHNAMLDHTLHQFDTESLLHNASSVNQGRVSPPLGANYNGLDIVSDITGGFYEGAPGIDLAAGPTKIVQTSWQSIRWMNKDGSSAVTTRLGRDSGGSITGAFFEMSNPAENPSATGTLYQVHTTYDQYDNRFVVSALQTRDTGTNESYIYVAVSQTSDPTGPWNKFRLDVSNGNTQYVNYFIGGDTSVGVSSEALYITADVFLFAGDTYQGSNVFIFPKGASSVYDNTTPTGTFTAYNPFMLALGQAVGCQVTHVYGTPPAGGGTWFTSSFYTTGTPDNFAVIEIVRLTDPFGTPTWTAHGWNVGAGGSDAALFGNFPNAPQPGGLTTVDAGEVIRTNAVYNNNLLAVVWNTCPAVGQANAGEVTVRYIRENVSAVSAGTGTWGADPGNSAGAFTFAPAVVVDSLNNTLVTFTASSPTVNPGAYYGSRLVTGLQAPLTLAAGTSSYDRSFGTTISPWGLTSAAVLDPTDGRAWVTNEYATTPGIVVDGAYPADTGDWATRIGNISFGPTVQTVEVVTPDPRVTAVNTWDVTFDRPITAATLTAADFTLTLNGGSNLLVGTEPVTLVSGNTYRINISTVNTLTSGTYVITINATGVADTVASGTGSASDTWVVASGDTTSPTVTGLYIDGSAWTTAFRTAAGNATFGYPAQTGAGQLTTMPWSTVNRFIITFSEPVNPLTVAQVGVRGVNVASYTVASITTLSATDYQINLAAPVDTDWFILDIDGSAATGVKDIALNALAGTFTENVSTFPTTGAGGVNFKYRFKITVGDADRNNLVRNADKNLVTANLFVDAGFAGYNMYADTNADGLVRNVDKNIVNAHLFVDGPTGGGPSRPRGGAAGGNGTTSNTGRVGRFTNGTAVGNDRTGSATRRLGSNLAVSAIDELFAQV